MTELRKRMIECLQLRGLAERTQEAYTRAVRQLAAHYHKSPDQISEAELRQYFLYLKNVKHYSRNTMTVAICGIRFFLRANAAKETGPSSASCARRQRRSCPSSSAWRKCARFSAASDYRATKFV